MGDKAKGARKEVRQDVKSVKKAAKIIKDEGKAKKIRARGEEKVGRVRKRKVRQDLRNPQDILDEMKGKLQDQAFKRKVKKAKRSVTTASKDAPETKEWTGRMVEKED